MSNYAIILTQTSCNVHDSMFLFVYYAALLPIGGGRTAYFLALCLSVCLSVRPVIVAIGNVFSSTASVTDVLFGMHWGPHIVRPSRPHKFLYIPLAAGFTGSTLHREFKQQLASPILSVSSFVRLLHHSDRLNLRRLPISNLAIAIALYRPKQQFSEHHWQMAIELTMW